MSILELIQTAEQRAEAIRQSANEQVKTLLETTKMKSEEEAKQLHLQAELDLKALENKFEMQIQKEKVVVEEKAIIEDELMIKKAKQQFNVATDFILKKVVIK
ncbi:MAG: hypothetical protein AB7V00_05085 [Bacilli bacterium]